MGGLWALYKYFFSLDFTLQGSGLGASINMDEPNMRETKTTPKADGRRGEAQIRRMLTRAGWTSGRQAGSGAPGSRSMNRARQGDLWAVCGGARLRVEVKHYKHEPRTLTALRAGSDVLAYICKSTGKVALFIDEGLFVDLLAWSAEALERGQR